MPVEIEYESVRVGWGGDETRERGRNTERRSNNRDIPVQSYRPNGSELEAAKRSA